MSADGPAPAAPDPALRAARRAANPFPGLRPFEAEDTHLFFGRDGQSTAIISLLARTRFVAVIGTSGSGKSSLVRAGLLPQLEGGLMASAGANWRIAVSTPGDAPMHHLATALAAPQVLGRKGDEAELRRAQIEAVLRRGSLGLLEALEQARLDADENLLVVVDQFEELFRMSRLRGEAGAAEAADFVALLLEATRQSTQPVYVVLTMRSDYLGDCARFRGLPEALNQGQYLVPRMSRDERRAAIEGPVAVGGAQIAPRLVQRLLNEVGDNPDQLPLLQHALMRCWNAWADSAGADEPIDQAHYEAVGTMQSALSRHADEALNGLPAERRPIARRLFQRLCERAADYRESRRPTRVAELLEVTGADLATLAEVVGAFRGGDRGFLALRPPQLAPDTVVDISHEALIRQWQTLRDWVAAEAGAAALYLRLAEDAERHGQNKVAPWVDPQLRAAEDWRRDWQPSEAWARRYHPGYAQAMAFLDLGVQERGRSRLGRWATWGAVALLLVVAPVVWTLYAKNQELDRSRKSLASKNEELNRSGTDLALKNQKLDQQNAELEEKRRVVELQTAALTYRADELTAAVRQAEAERRRAEQLSQALRAGRLAMESRNADGELGALLAVEALAVARTAETDSALWQVLARPPELAPLAGNDTLRMLAWSADGQRLGTLDEEGRLGLWDAASGRRLALSEPRATPVAPALLAVLPDGAGVVAVDSAAGLALQRPLPDERMERLGGSAEAHAGRRVTQLQLSRDGRWAATGDASGRVALWRLSPAPVLLRTLQPLTDLASLALDAEAERLAVADKSGAVRVLRFADGQPLASLAGGAGPRLRFAGQTLVVLGNDRLERWLPPAFDRSKSLLPAGARPPRRLHASADGRRLYALSDGSLLRWQVDAQGEPASRGAQPLARLVPARHGPLPTDLDLGAAAESADGRLAALQLVQVGAERQPVQRFAPLLLILPAGGNGGAAALKLPAALSMGFASGDRLLLVGTYDGVRRIDLSDGGWRRWAQRLPGSDNDIVALALAGGETPRLLALDEAGRLHRDSADAAAPLRSDERQQGAHDKRLQGLAPDHSGILLSPISGSNQATSHGLAWYPAQGDAVVLPARSDFGTAVDALAASAGGHRLAWALRDGAGARLQVWELATRQPLATLNHPDGGQQWRALAFSADGRWLAAVSEPPRGTAPASRAMRPREARGEPAAPPQLAIWDLQAGGAPRQRELASASERSWTLGFSRDGRWLAVTNRQDSSLWVLATASPTLEPVLRARAELGAFTLDGSQLVVAEEGAGVHVHGLGQGPGPNRIGQAPRVLSGSEARITSLAPSPDGRWLLAGSRDGSLYLWSVADWRPRQRLAWGHRDAISALGFAADGGSAVSADAGGWVTHWSLGRPDALPPVAELLCQRVRRNLDLEQWQSHLGNQPFRATCRQAESEDHIGRALMRQALRMAIDGDAAGARARALQALQAQQQEGPAAEPETLNTLCYRAALVGAAAQALPLCQRAVRQSPGSGEIHDSLAVALALTGRRAEAAREFAAALADRNFPEQYRAQRLAWMRLLQQGRHPFDATLLHDMRLADSMVD
ncbi:MAG: hypothetical protein KBC73_01715 [Burkholderiaceae bacterium]|nr:hypothetical protein [Burkholderiaceae bacterium]